MPGCEVWLYFVGSEGPVKAFSRGVTWMCILESSVRRAEKGWQG